MKYHNVRFQPYVSMFIIFVLFLSNALAQSIEKSPSDPRDYDYFVLANGLEVLVISDKEADKSFGILHVKVGAWDDPKPFYGLAHFTEHMVASSSSKYPEINALSKFVSENGGMANASTDYQNTLYIFSSNNDAFDKALDMFSSSFGNDDFNVDFLDREREAVNSEYILSKSDRKIVSANMLRFNPNHPISNFFTGSLDTLKDQNGKKLYDEVLNFYKVKYSSDKMRVVLLSNDSIEKLREDAIRHFSKMPRVNTIDYPISEPILRKEDLAKDLQYRSNNENAELNVLFHLPRDFDKNIQYFSYINKMLSNKSKGGLISYLKEEGLANTVVPYYYPLADISAIGINVILTDKGAEYTDEITAYIYKYLDYVKNNLIQEQLINQFKNIDKRAYEHESYTPASTLFGLTESFLRSKTNSLKEINTYGNSFDKPLYKEVLHNILSEMNWDNAHRIYSDKYVEGELYEKYYDVNLNISKVTEEKYNSWFEGVNDPEFNLDLSLEYEPKDLNIRKKDAFKEKIKIINGNEKSKIWKINNSYLTEPKTNFSLFLHRNNIPESKKDIIYDTILAKAIEESLKGINEKAEYSGMRHVLSWTGYRADISVYGLGQKQALIIENSIQELLKLKVSEDDYNRYLDEFKDSALNFINNTSSLNKVLIVNHILLSHKSIKPTDIIAMLDLLSYEEFLIYLNKSLSSFSPEYVINGNINTEEALSKVSLLDRALGGRVSDKFDDSSKLANPNVNLPLGEKIYSLESKVSGDTAVVKYFQTNDLSLEKRVMLSILKAYMHNAFFNKIRTEEQLGYVVAIIDRSTIYKDHGLTFIAVSPEKDAKYISNRIDKFILDYMEGINSLTQDKLDEITSALIKDYLFENQDILSVSEKYFLAILSGHNNFDVNKKMASIAESIGLEEIKEFYKELFFDKRSSFLAFVYNPNNVTDGVKELMASKSYINDTDIFKEKVRYFDVNSRD